MSRASRSRASAAIRAGRERGRSKATSAAVRKATVIAELAPSPPPRGDSLARETSNGGNAKAEAITPISDVSESRASSSAELASITLAPWRTRNPLAEGRNFTVTARSTATLTVGGPGWSRPRGQMSRVPPPKSTRHQALTATSEGIEGKRLARHSGTRGLRRGVAGCELSISPLDIREMHRFRQLDVAHPAPKLVPPRPEGRQASLRDRFVADPFERQRIDPAFPVLHPVVQL